MIDITSITNGGYLIGLIGLVVALGMLLRDMVKNQERRSSVISAAIIIVMILIAMSELV